MDCGTADFSTDVAQVSSGEDSSSCDDFVPLSKLMRRHTSDNSSDDVALIKKKTKSKTAEKPVKKVNKSSKSIATNDKKADKSPDNEPLIKIAKKASKDMKKPFSVPPTKPVDTKKKESLDDDSLDDEPLSELAKKMHSKSHRKAAAKTPLKASPVMKSKRNVARKGVKYAETSGDGSDNEPPATTKGKPTKAPRKQKSAAKRQKTTSKLKGSPSKDCSSDDDDVPLASLITKKKTSKTAVSEVSTSKKTYGLCDESSEDEAMINVVKKKCTETKMKAPKKKDTPPKKQEKMPESLSNSSDDEPLNKAAKHPQVTKIVRIILERCDSEECGATQGFNKSGTDGVTKHLFITS